MRLVIRPDYEEVSRWAANHVAARIKESASRGEARFVLGLPTGSSPLGLYRQLVALNRAGKVSFDRVVTFNMDEYVGLPEDHPESYHSFMWSTSSRRSISGGRTSTSSMATPPTSRPNARATRKKCANWGE